MSKYIKCIVMGWSIICVGIILVSYQIMKSDYIAENYEVLIPNMAEAEIDGKKVALDFILFPVEKDTITRDEFVERVKEAKGIEITSHKRVVDKRIYLYLPIYSFIVWALPILIFISLGMLYRQSGQKSA